MFETLVTEVLEQIFDSLNKKKDLLTVRLVCRRFHDISLRVFGKTYFTTLELDLSTPCLQRLNDIGNNERLRFFPKKLIFQEPWQAAESLDIPQPAPLGFAWDRTFSRLPNNLIEDDQGIVYTLIDILTSKFVNCREFEITDVIELPSPDQEDAQNILWPTDVVNIMLTAISKGNIAVESFGIHFIKRAYLDEEKLNLDTLDEDSFKENWKTHLREIRFKLSPHASTSMLFLSRTVALAKNLKTLSIEDMHSRHSDIANLFRDLDPDGDIPPIETLKLGDFQLYGLDELTKTILLFKNTLKHIMLVRITLDQGTLLDLVSALRVNMFPSLQSVKFHRIRESRIHSHSRQFVRVYFCTRCHTSDPHYKDLELVGSKSVLLEHRAFIGTVRFSNPRGNGALELLGKISFVAPMGNHVVHGCQPSALPAAIRLRT